MPLRRGEVTIGAQTLEVKPFYWPVPPLRTVEHVTATGRLVEVDTTTRLQDVEIELVGDEETGWRLMTDTLRAALEALFQAGAPVTVTDWRGNTGTFMFLDAPEFEDIASSEATPLLAFWGFRLRLGRIT